jgi:hypothetical protein
MIPKISLLPCMVFFKAGKTGAGIATLLMQLSILLWPVAIAMARAARKQSAIETILADYATQYPLPMGVVVDRLQRRDSKTADGKAPLRPGRQFA